MVISMLQNAYQKAEVDWSYASRKKMLSFKCDPSQTKLTQYYKLVTEVDLLSKSNPELMKGFDNANKE